jgi:hypothetical protein
MGAGQFRFLVQLRKFGPRIFADSTDKSVCKKSEFLLGIAEVLIMGKHGTGNLIQ